MPFRGNSLLFSKLSETLRHITTVLQETRRRMLFLSSTLAQPALFQLLQLFLQRHHVVRQFRINPLPAFLNLAIGYRAVDGRGGDFGNFTKTWQWATPACWRASHCDCTNGARLWSAWLQKCLLRNTTAGGCWTESR